MESIVYNQQGGEVGKFALPESIFSVKWNPDLVHQVVTSMQSSARSGTAHTKTRGEVRGGGRKPWKQKGTGRARHGSIRSPLWVGGGVTHGPRSEKNYARKVNKKMKRQALLSLLSRKYKDGEIIFLQGLSVADGRTREAKKIFDALSAIDDKLQRGKNAAFIALPRKEEKTLRGFRNFSNIGMGEARNLNVLDVLKYTYIVIAEPEESLKSLTRHE